MHTNTDSKTPLWTKNFVTIIIVNLVIFFGYQMLMPTLPKYIQSLGIDNSHIGLISGIITVSTLLIRPFAGQILDRIGRKQVLWGGFIIYMFMVTSYSWISTVGMLLLVRFLHGFGWGATTTASNTIASDVIPKKRFGEGMGYFSLASSIAMATAPAIGLSLLLRYDFRFITYFSSALALVALLISFTVKYQEVPKIPQDAKVKRAIYDLSAFKPALITFFVTVTYGSITSFLSLYASERGIENIGIYFTVYAAFLLLSRPFFGRIVDRRGFGYAIIPGLICLLISMILLSFSMSLPLFLLAGVFYGIGFGATQSSLQTMALVSVPRERFGAATATFFTGFDSGIGIGTVIAGLISTAVGYAHMYLILSASILIAFVLYFVIGKKPKADDLPTIADGNPTTEIKNTPEN